ncbi:DUF4440 domain-containing protein [Allokutzneria sp. A3M-2-11 16]|uniref:YybH family protein n=1 Tax=Allokutzneria sp. A3M-2-11 16 TaxID=2962043 RepID=UPI0020B869A8|nr:nuclear transport factor 2 family protein [Allokutzneria sp. A3M-2-11 16]MCP3804791.1 DUF4440 domain-containing protein [Allokutzneria sp. A3M-2-11 16]
MTLEHDVLRQHIADWVELFNRGDTAAVDALYADDGLLVPVPGHPVSGPARAAATQYLIDQGARMSAEVRHCYVAGDIALLIVDWSLEGVGMKGTATDVLRRDADGRWRYVIDNPAGVG